MSETDLSRSIRKALKTLGVWCVRIQCGMARGWRDDGLMLLADKGTPDIWTPHGWLECKTKTGRLTKDQKLWHARASREGVRVATVTSIREALETVQQWREQDRQRTLDRIEGDARKASA
jgi:hypothetical protein